MFSHSNGSDELTETTHPRNSMNEILKEALAPLIAAVVYFLLKRAERLGYEQGYEDGINDRRPKYRNPIGFRSNNK